MVTIMPNPTPYQLHVLDWKNCQRCECKDWRVKVCIGRGQIPCDIVFIGQAPGKSEDILGFPFVGEAGHLISEIVDMAFGGFDPPITYAFTNLVGCIPQMGTDGKEGEPSAESILACRDRVIEFVRIANPMGVVLLGKHASNWIESGKRFSRNSIRLPLGRGKPIPLLSTIHPAAIKRMNVGQQLFNKQRLAVAISTFVDGLLSDDQPPPPLNPVPYDPPDEFGNDFLDVRRPYQPEDDFDIPF